MVSPSANRSPLWVFVCAFLLVVVPLTSGTDAGPLDQNDAGSGRDAPDEASKAITIQPGVIYEGMSPGPLVDSYDVYHLTGEEGDVFEGWSDGNLGCYHLLDAQGDPFEETACSYEHAPTNTGPLVIDLPYSGDYYFKVVHLAPAIYQFGFNLSGAAPEVRTVVLLPGEEAGHADKDPLPIPEGCDGDFVYVPGMVGDIPRFTDDCYHMRTGLNSLDTPQIDILIVPPVSTYPERDLRVMRQAVQMWVDGIHALAQEMGLDWLDEGVRFQVFVGDGNVTTDPLWDPEIVVVASNPAGGAGIGTDPLDVFGRVGPCHGQPNPLATLEDWGRLPDFDSHHDGKSGTYTTECEGGGSICYAVNGAIDPAPGFIDFFGLYDLVAHEVGHCLTVGHVGDALDHEAEAVPLADIMAYADRPHDKCVSTLDVEAFALTMSRFLLETPLGPNDGDSAARGTFQIKHPDDHRYASPTGLAEDCPQPDAGLIPQAHEHLVPTQDDAGSGRDAPNDPSKAITIEPDVVYRGMSPGPGLDNSDVYHLVGQAGQVFEGSAEGNMGCFYLVDAQGETLQWSCSYGHAPVGPEPITIELPDTGDYYFRVNHLAPAIYHFAFDLDGDAPPVGLLDQA